MAPVFTTQILEAETRKRLPRQLLSKNFDYTSIHALPAHYPWFGLEVPRKGAGPLVR